MLLFIEQSRSRSRGRSRTRSRTRSRRVIEAVRVIAHCSAMSFSNNRSHTRSNLIVIIRVGWRITRKEGMGKWLSASAKGILTSVGRIFAFIYSDFPESAVVSFSTNLQTEWLQLWRSRSLGKIMNTQKYWGGTKISLHESSALCKNKLAYGYWALFSQLNDKWTLNFH